MYENMSRYSGNSYSIFHENKEHEYAKVGTKFQFYCNMHSLQLSSFAKEKSIREVSALRSFVAAELKNGSFTEIQIALVD